jgi:hypothetical protein
VLVTNVVVETLPGKAECVADVIGHLKGMALVRLEDGHRVVAAWVVPDGHSPEPEGLCETLRAIAPEILDVALSE